MPTETEFDQAGYWIKRHEDLADDPRSVGNLAATRDQNQAGELALIDTVGAFARQVGPEVRSVLDLGCGYGRVTGAFLGAGIAYTGRDISAEALTRARRDWPAAEFIETNLLHWTPGQTYDLVCVLYVLVHFVDDADWARFFAAAADSVAEGGLLLIADVFPDVRGGAAHYVARPFADYAPLAERAGLNHEPAVTDTLFRERADDPNRAHFRVFRKRRTR